MSVWLLDVCVRVCVGDREKVRVCWFKFWFAFCSSTPPCWTHLKVLPQARTWPQQLCDWFLEPETLACSKDIRFLSALLCSTAFCLRSSSGSSGCVGVFQRPVAGSLPMTVLWTSSSWGVSAAKDRRRLEQEGREWLPLSRSASLPPSLCLSLSVCFRPFLLPSRLLPFFDFPRHRGNSIKKKRQSFPPPSERLLLTWPDLFLHKKSHKICFSNFDSLAPLDSAYSTIFLCLRLVWCVFFSFFVSLFHWWQAALWNNATAADVFPSPLFFPHSSSVAVKTLLVVQFWLFLFFPLCLSKNNISPTSQLVSQGLQIVYKPRECKLKFAESTFWKWCRPIETVISMLCIRTFFKYIFLCWTTSLKPSMIW